MRIVNPIPLDTFASVRQTLLCFFPARSMAVHRIECIPSKLLNIVSILSARCFFLLLCALASPFQSKHANRKKRRSWCCLGNSYKPFAAPRVHDRTSLTHSLRSVMHFLNCCFFCLMSNQC